jgi:hypothetical protein
MGDASHDGELSVPGGVLGEALQLLDGRVCLNANPKVNGRSGRPK